MPVGTHGTVKALTPDQVRATGAEIVLANTYHLMLRPGRGVVEKLGGLHAFMRWDGPILTDSGGFQVFSLSQQARSRTTACASRATSTAREMDLTPERSIEVQNALGADIIMAFDECPPYPADERARAHRRAPHARAGSSAACGAHARPSEQALFGIVQGSVYRGAAPRAAPQAVVAIDLPGYRDRRRLGRRGARAALPDHASRRRRCCPRTSRAT